MKSDNNNRKKERKVEDKRQKERKSYDINMHVQQKSGIQIVIKEESVAEDKEQQTTMQQWFARL